MDDSSRSVLPPNLLAAITEQRIADPDLPLRIAAARKRRAQLTTRCGSNDGKLTILAADHPARGATRIGQDPLRMAHRGELLGRIAWLLAEGAADGVLATMDLIEDLLVVHQQMEQTSRGGFLEEKLLLASLNRGGLDGSRWELDDPWTGPDPESCARWKLDGVKLLLRIDLDDPASLRTLVMCADALRRFEPYELPVFLELLPVVRGPQGLEVLTEGEALARLVSVASGLGNSSRRVWLKLPLSSDFERVVAATTLPITVLGGALREDPLPFFQRLAAALAAAANVRGTIIGRNVLYPTRHDPLALARAIDGMVHQQWSAEQAMQILAPRDT